LLKSVFFWVYTRKASGLVRDFFGKKGVFPEEVPKQSRRKIKWLSQSLVRSEQIPASYGLKFFFGFDAFTFVFGQKTGNNNTGLQIA